jgi:beta-phosphoglucomutase
MHFKNPQILNGQQIKACIFDLDGVLVDTAIYHFKAWRRLSNQLGFDFTLQQNEELKGVSRVESLNKILNWSNFHLNETEKLKLANLKNEWYVEMISTMTTDEILPGTSEFLTDIKKLGYKLALGSASKNAILILEKTKLIHFFDVIVDGNVVANSKPDPQVFLKGAELLQVNANECIVFEDAVAGIAAAKAAGMKCIGIGDKHLLHQADYVVSGFNNLTSKDLIKI